MFDGCCIHRQMQKKKRRVWLKLLNILSCQYRVIVYMIIFFIVAHEIFATYRKYTFRYGMLFYPKNLIALYTKILVPAFVCNWEYTVSYLMFFVLYPYYDTD